MKQILTILMLGFALMFSSCTIEKRHYTDGYHVEWQHRDKHKVELNEPASAQQTDVAECKTETTVTETTTTTSSIQEETNCIVRTKSEIVASNNEVKKEIVRSEKSEEKPIQRSTFRSQLREMKNQNAVSATVAVSENGSSSSQNSDLLLIIIAIFVSPLAVYLHEGSWNTTCWINLVLWLLFILPGFIHALIVILGS